MKKKWIEVQVTQAVFDDMKEQYYSILPKEKKEKRKYNDLPYLDVIITGKAPEKKSENFKKVKFPAFCIYGWNKECVGVINMAFLGKENGDPIYELHDITKQHDGINRQSGFESLEEMDELYNIREIVKAKIIIKRG